MREDRLRALRAIRFAARLEFDIEPATWVAVRDSAGYLTRLSAERVKQELEKTMDQVRAPSRALRLWRQSGAMQVLLPELLGADEALLAVDCVAQPGPSRRPGRRVARFAVLFSEMPAAAAQSLATRLRFSRHDAQWIAMLVDRWHALGGRIAATLAGEAGKAVATDADVRRWIATIGRTHLPAFFRLASARWAARRLSGSSEASPTAQSVHSLYRRGLRAALREPVDLRDLAVDGDDLREAGIPPGPALGKILTALLDQVLEDPGLNKRDRLLEAARRLHSSIG
jgi:tRNA nucleotidyltransferase/poly(A) polymerase